MGIRLRPLMFVRIIVMAIFWESSIEGLTLQYSVDVAKLSIERSFLVLEVYNYCLLYGVAGCLLFRGF